MFPRQNTLRLLTCCGIYSSLILFGICDAATTRRRATLSDPDNKLFADTLKSILNEINLVEGGLTKDTRKVFETVCRDFRFPVKTKLELINDEEITRTDPIAARFRRDDRQWTDGSRRSSTRVRKGGEEEVADFVHEMLSMLEDVDSNREPGFYTGWVEQDTRNASMKTLAMERNGDPVMARSRRSDKATAVSQNVPGKDYMSTYYAQRKAIMDKYKSQQREIMERLKRTKSLIAETKKLKESKKTQDQSPVPQNSNISHQGEDSSTVAPNPTTSSDFVQTTLTPDAEVPMLNSTIVNDTEKPSPNNSESVLNSSDYESADYSTEFDSPSSTLPPVNETLRPFIDEKVDIIEEGDWPSESVNFIPENEVDSNLTEQGSIRQERDNDTVISDLGDQPGNPSSKNESAFDQLEKMFLWEVPAGDESSPRSEEDSVVKNAITISGNDRPDNTSGSSDSLRFTVEIKSSPEVQVTKNIKNVQTSTTTYRNSTHEIVEVNGVVNSTKRIDGAPVDLPNFENTNFTNATRVEEENGGGARESEWCEECAHDYRWGDCDGTLFYQHNIFLRNRGPSAIDAIFGMNVQGPVSITCVEAIRFNQTRGIVTLHSGGQGHDFAKLRIRGFEGEGFSYIMKVWGVADEDAQ